MGTGTPILDTNEVRLDVEEVIIHPSFSPYSDRVQDIIISLYNFRITIHAGISGRNDLNVNV